MDRIQEDEDGCETRLATLRMGHQSIDRKDASRLQGLTILTAHVILVDGNAEDGNAEDVLLGQGYQQARWGAKVGLGYGGANVTVPSINEEKVG